MDDKQHAFHLEEYRQIRAEVGVLLARVENLFRYSLIVAATIYAWLIVQSVGLTQEGNVCLKLPVTLLRPGWLIPPVFVVLASALAFAAYWRINQMGGYLKLIESAIGVAKLGWEKYLEPKAPVVTGTTVVVCALLLGASLYGTSQGMTVQGKAVSGGKAVACKAEAGKP